MRIHEGGDQVGGSWAGGRDTHANLARRHRIPLRRMARTLLVTDQDVFDLGRIEKRIVGLDNGSTRKPEDYVDAEFLQRANNRACTRGLLPDSAQLCCGLCRIANAAGGHIGRCWSLCHVILLRLPELCRYAAGNKKAALSRGAQHLTSRPCGALVKYQRNRHG